METMKLSGTKTDAEIREERQKEIEDAVDRWCGYYRLNPDRFVEEFLNIKLKTFQKILLHMMMSNNIFMFIASRGLGKSFLVAIYCVVRCILYPGSKIVVASKTLKQAREVLKKITEDFMKNRDWGSELLCNELDVKATTDKGNDPQVIFRNGSAIYAVVANENARSKRSNINIYDEFVQMNNGIIDSVLDKFLTSPRSPGYLSNPKYSYLAEDNKKFYMSSAWYKSHWSFNTLLYDFKAMFTGGSAFTCCIPYQCGIKEGIILPQTIKDEYLKPEFNEVTFSMEYEGIFFGSNGEEFFRFDDIEPRRILDKALPNIDVVISKNINIDPPPFRCRRILSVDVALMASTSRKKNDASSLVINDAIATSNDKYIANIVYIENYEGLTTDELGLQIMRFYYKYKCTDLVLDTNGVGLPVFDYICKDHIDPETGELYKALSCCNDEDMAKRCLVSDAKRVVWSIKANAKFNSDAANLLRNGFKSSNINLLKNEYDAEDILIKDKFYASLSENGQFKYRMSYVNTTLAVHELINLQYEVNGTNIKIKEKRGERKDRYSSLSYNYYVMKVLENRLQKESLASMSDVHYMARKPKRGISML